MSKQTKHYTNIEDYIRERHKDFAQVIDYCQLFHVMAPRPASDGVTVIIPTKAYLEKIHKKSQDPKVEVIGDACDSILSLIIRGAKKTPSDWKEDVADMRFPSQELTTTVDGQSVKFVKDKKPYATIKIADDFSPAFRTNIAVWQMTDGEMRLEKDSNAPPRKKTPRRRAETSKVKTSAKAGAYVPRPEHLASIRFRLGIIVENEFVRQMSLPSERRCNPFLAYVCSFAKFMCAKYTDEFYNCVLPVIGYRMIDFYALFEPHKAMAPYLIDDERIAEWWASAPVPAPFNMGEFRKWVDGCLKNHHPAKIYSDPEAVVHAADALRGECGERANIQDKTQCALQAYKTLAGENKLGELSDIYPEGIAKYYHENPTAKIIHDELSFAIEPPLLRIWSVLTPSNPIAEIRKYVRIISHLMHEHEAVVRQHLLVLNPAKAQFLEVMVTRFIDSTHFLWIPLPDTMIRNYPIQVEEALDTVIENAEAQRLEDHMRIFAASDEQSKVAINRQAIAAFEALKDKPLTEEMKAYLEDLLKQSK